MDVLETSNCVLEVGEKSLYFEDSNISLHVSVRDKKCLEFILSLVSCPKTKRAINDLLMEV